MDRREALSVLAALGSMAWGTEASAEHEPLAVVMKHNVLKRALSPSELHAIFTTRLKDVDGQRVIPFNYAARSELRVVFDRAVLHMDPDEVARYWIDRRVRGGAPPPKQVSSAKVMLAVAAKLRSAIGYVPEKMVNDRVQVVARIINGKVVGPA